MTHRETKTPLVNALVSKHVEELHLHGTNIGDHYIEMRALAESLEFAVMDARAGMNWKDWMEIHKDILGKT